MKANKNQESKEKKDLNLEKDDKRFPASQFNKDQRKDAEKGLSKNVSEDAEDREKGEAKR